MKQKIFWGNHAAQDLLLGETVRSLPHAVLLYGEKGLGKKRMAHLLACRYLTKPEAYHKTDAFFSSPEAELVFTDSHPDVTVLTEEAPSIKVDDIRNLSETIYFAPNQSEGRVFIIESAERMNVQAQNALLKLLEDPPGQVHFILTSSVKYAFLETILSRVWAVELLPLGENELKGFLEERLPDVVDTYNLEEALENHPGNGGLILEGIEGGLSPERQLANEIVDAMLDQSVYQISLLLEKEKKNRALLFNVFTLLEEYVEKALLKGTPQRPEKALLLEKTLPTERLYDILYFFNKIKGRWILNPSLSILNMEAAAVLGGVSRGTN